MDKLLVYGGTFNPIHCGHLHLAAAFQHITGAQHVMLIPTRVPPHKEAPELVSAQHRLEMCRLAVKSRGWQVSDLEIRRQTPSYTSDTLQQLSEQYPCTRLYFVTGEDMFLTLLSWHDPACIFRLATICAAPRSIEGLPRMAAFAERLRAAGGQCIVKDVNYLPISSTQVRKEVQAGHSVSGLVPPAVASYIAQNSLYSIGS